MTNPSSPLDTLRQLKEMLDAGALTPTEFEALKQRLVFSESTALPVPPADPSPAAPVAPEAGPSSAHIPPATAPPTITELRSPSLDPAPLGPVPPVESVETTPDAPFFPESQAGPAGPPAPSAPRALAQAEPDPNSGWATDEFPEAETAPARSPLALILSIGGLLVLLSLVVYLSLNRPPSERISSTSLTAADSVAAPIETGPQAEPLAPPVAAAPETVRVAPTNPAPPLPARPAPVARDSAASAPADTVGP